MENQARTVETFAEKNALKINPSKCEVVAVSSKKNVNSPLCSVANQAIYPSAHAKCLGFWWSWDLSANISVGQAINSACRAFFAYGVKGSFHGQVNPVTGRVILETCSLPILLYGSQNWFITESLLGKLEAFQNEIGQRIIRLPSCHSGRAVRLGWSGPQWPVDYFREN